MSDATFPHATKGEAQAIADLLVARGVSKRLDTATLRAFLSLLEGLLAETRSLQIRSARDGFEIDLVGEAGTIRFRGPRLGTCLLAIIAGPPKAGAD